MPTPTPKAPRKTAALHTLGCRLNASETETLRQKLEAEGYELVDWQAEADVYVLNSCTVTAQSDAKSRQALRGARRRNPQARVAVVGCYAQMDAQNLAENQLADVVVGSAEKLELAHWLPQLQQGGKPQVLTPPVPRQPFWQGTPTLPPPQDDGLLGLGSTRSHLKIQDGCDFMCSFCIIPFARGRARPRALADLLAEARQLLAAGVKELVLTGVNLGTYPAEGLWADSPHNQNTSPPDSAEHLEAPGAPLVQIVEELAPLPGLHRLRISSIEPTTVHPQLLRYMADPSHPLVPFLHLPLQSGSDAVLQAMRRRYNANEYRQFAAQALEAVPGLYLSADVMVGFPGESEADFEATYGLLQDLPLASFHLFPFSARKGTPALRLPGRVPAEEMRRRMSLLQELAEAKRLAFFKTFVGQRLPVLFENPAPAALKRGMVPGYTANYIRVEVPAPTGQQGNKPKANDLLLVELLEASAGRVAGQLVEES